MKAPWAQQPSSGGTAQSTVDKESANALPNTGTPVLALIDVQPALPTVNTNAWPQEWLPAKKRIHREEDMQKALKSDGLRSFVAFTLSLNEAVTKKKLSDECHISPTLQKILDALDVFYATCEQIPPSKQSMRYGNPAYKIWAARMQGDAPQIVMDILGDEACEAVIEVLPYLLDSFGNNVRIDYGTGHETNFVAFLYCLFSLGVLTAEDRQAVVTKVFTRYLQVMRKLQTTYWLEPAGSHGVWGLDDYQFYPYIWGAAQLIDHPILKPKSIMNDDMLEGFASEYMYMASVMAVKAVKKGPLHETSPMLYDISGVPSWSKVNSGLLKMYQVELLSKVPIMQHFLWGSLLPYPE